MKQEAKANSFRDNRIGERNSRMTQEERDLLRYQKEIQVELCYMHILHKSEKVQKQSIFFRG